MKKYTINLKMELKRRLIEKGHASKTEAEYIASVLCDPRYDECEVLLKEQGMSADHLADIALEALSRV